ncbi:MAG: hypothetical protein CME26_03010 [Gemmatimonadetes bacterium]|nr:hypothetical protein [Gemmatimonadota bacterium]
MDVNSKLPVSPPRPVSALIGLLDRQGGLVRDVHPVRVMFLRNFTIEPIAPFLKYHLLRDEIRAELGFGNYGDYVQAILSGDIKVNGSDPDVIVSSLLLEPFHKDFEISNWEDDPGPRIEALFDAILERTRAVVVANTFLRPDPVLFGHRRAGDRSLDIRTTGLNQVIREYAEFHPSRFVLIDFEAILMRFGAKASLDARSWYSSLAPFRFDFLDRYAREIGNVIRSLRGHAKKCLVLDCDNTLWGGVVGEDGIKGVDLDPNGNPGRIYYDFQKSVLQLESRGVVLALCSKNNEEDVLDLLDQHPHCLLNRDHIAAHRINWLPKHQNLSSLSDELNLSTDSMVFVDDSEVEQGLIESLMPEVMVLPVPQKLHQLPRLFLEHDPFDVLSKTEEDRSRTRMYQEQQGRKRYKERLGSVEEYLKSLGTCVRVHEATSEEIARVSQLTQKTNQFNLTTRRYSEAEIQAMAGDEESAVYTLSVSDRFGDSGLTGVFIAKRKQETGRVDTFLMSCRVLGRELETAFASECINHLCASWGNLYWTAEYIPTSKNEQTADFWPSFGMEQTGKTKEGVTFSADAQDLKLTVPSHISLEPVTT